MKLLPLLFFVCILHQATIAQTDSATAFYLKSLVDRIDSRLDGALIMSSDTTVADEKGSITVHTDYYIERNSGEVEKIFERSLFGQVSTEITVYYRAGSPILFQTKQWEGSKLTVDFDYYYQNDNPVYIVKREFAKGSPDGDEIRKWCYQMIKESKSNKLVRNEEEEIYQQDQKRPAPFKKPATAKKSIFPFFKKKKK